MHYLLKIPQSWHCVQTDLYACPETATLTRRKPHDPPSDRHRDIEHADAGWDHYADKWELLTPEGTVLGIRTLHHPHVGEQPFTRSLSGVKIPATVAEVTVRAHDSVHTYGGNTQTIKVPH